MRCMRLKTWIFNETSLFLLLKIFTVNETDDTYANELFRGQFIQ